VTVTDTDRGLAKLAQTLIGANSRVRVGILSGPAAAKMRLVMARDASGRFLRGRYVQAPPKPPGEKGGKLSLVEIAAIHEFGAPDAGIPQRSWCRGTVDEKVQAIRSMQAALARQVIQGKITGRIAMERLGAYIVGLMQARIARGIEPPLKPATIAAKKGKETPLIRTGQLRSSITYAVEGQ
jgi:hypothetical protein